MKKNKKTVTFVTFFDYKIYNILKIKHLTKNTKIMILYLLSLFDNSFNFSNRFMGYSFHLIKPIVLGETKILM